MPAAAETTKGRLHPVWHGLFQPRVTWATWGAFLLVLCMVGVATGFKRHIDAYDFAAARWLAGEQIYSMGGTGFIYLPSSALLYLPFHWLGNPVGQIAWRCLNVGLLAWAIWRWSERSGRNALAPLFGVTTALTMAVLWGTARNGQMTVLMTGLWLLGGLDFSDRRYWRATLWLGIALALKPLSLVIVGIIAVIAPREMSWRLALAGAAGLLFPFLCQQPSFVAEQYALALTAVGTASAIAFPAADLFGITRTLGWDLSREVMLAVRIAAAPAAVWLAWVGWRRLGGLGGAWLIFAWAAIYTLLFSPRTEGNTYVLLAPALALAAAWAWLVERRGALAAVLAGGIIALVLNYELIYRLTGSKKWMPPTVAVLFALWLIRQTFAARPLLPQTSRPRAGLVE